MNKTARLSSTLEVPRLIIGLWQIADMERKNPNLDLTQAARAMNPYIQAGFTTFDMADHYGSSEIIAGICKNNAAEKDPIKLLTKWVPKPGTIDKKTVREAVLLALERMQQSSIDLLQFHAWQYKDPSWLDALFYLKELKEEGLIKNIGVTNFDAYHLRIALSSGIPIVSNQISHSILDRRALGDMKLLCETFHIHLLAYGTLLGGFLSEKWLDKKLPKAEELSTWSQMKYIRFIEQAGGWTVFQKLLSCLNQIAQKHQTTMPILASRFVLENPNVASVIIGARLGESAHIDSHKAVLDFNFDPDDLEEIDKALALLRPLPGNCGDEYRKPPFLTASGDLSHHLETFPPVYEKQLISESRAHVYSGTVWESFAGYARAVRKGNTIMVSGTTATHGKQIIGMNDAAAQTHFIIDKIEASLHALGAGLEDVIRTRIFVHSLEDWEAVAQAHGVRFKNIDPANTLVQAKLVGEGYKVEIEAQAQVDDSIS
jgi:aryl-alcohol dehydrogenase-like predicted oxidoreductase/enamine deaminase RidA (YjgF/YER057c/UK114 family)